MHSIVYKIGANMCRPPWEGRSKFHNGRVRESSRNDNTRFKIEVFERPLRSAGTGNAQEQSKCAKMVDTVADTSPLKLRSTHCQHFSHYPTLHFSLSCSPHMQTFLDLF